MSSFDLKALASRMLADNALLTSAQRRAGTLVNGDPKDMHLCCAATLSYCLIEGLGISLKPLERAMQLAYALEHEMHFSLVSALDELRPGDIGIVDQPKSRVFLDSADIQGLFGDGPTSELHAFAGSYQYTGAGYIERDRDNRNWHHIYLVLDPLSDNSHPDICLVADNQRSTPYLRDKTGGKWSATNYFLRAPSA